MQAASVDSAVGGKALPLPLHYVKLKVQAYKKG